MVTKIKQSWLTKIKQCWLDSVYADKVLFPDLVKRIGVYLIYGLSICALLLCGLALLKGNIAMGIVLAVASFYLQLLYFSLWMGKATCYINEKEKQCIKEA